MRETLLQCRYPGGPGCEKATPDGPCCGQKVQAPRPTAPSFPHGPFAYVAFALGHVETTAEGSDVRIEGLRALNELGAILLDVQSVCETLPGKLAAGNTEGALTEIEWLSARVKEAADA